LSDNSFHLAGEARLPGRFKELFDEQLKLAPKFTPTSPKMIPTQQPFTYP
jgi:hypothetical protein